MLTPEAVIYEPQSDGDMGLVAVEYVVFKSAWREEHPTGRPQLLGQTLRAGQGRQPLRHPDVLQASHVWAWQANQNGMFEDWNPDVTCEFAEPPA